MVGCEAGESGKGLLGGSGEQMQHLSKADVTYCLLCFSMLFEVHYLISPPNPEQGVLPYCLHSMTHTFSP